VKHIKNMPNWLAHSIFVNTDTEIVELKGSEVDLFFALIYLTSQSYDHDKSTPKTTTFIYQKSKIQAAIKENKTLNDAMEKLNGLEIITNILGSYGDGEPNRFKPFVITPIKSGTRVGKFKIEVQEKFIKEFSNPNPKFTLSYEYISAFTNTQAKLLYIILFDYLGMIKENNLKKPKSRIIDLEKLKVLMNRSFEYEVEKLLRDINTAVNLINKYTDIKIIKHFNEGDEYDENITNHKFTMIRTKPYQLYETNVENILEQDGNSITQQTHDDEEAWQETLKRFESRNKNKNLDPIKNEKSWLDKTYTGIVADKKKKQAEKDKEQEYWQEQKRISEDKLQVENPEQLINEILEEAKSQLEDTIITDNGIPIIIFRSKGMNSQTFMYIDKFYDCITNMNAHYTDNPNKTLNMINGNGITFDIHYLNNKEDKYEKMYFY